jgi:hypothetical protein
VGTGEGDPGGEPVREWACGVCGQPVLDIVGIAVLAEGQLRFWTEGYCAEHQRQVRESLETQAREGRPPEIMVKRLLTADEVDGWMQRVRREAGVS